ncbi:hypothetical protein NCER_101003 [Vairimorpha ceranae BRL01]|uniref:Uncharacterized protein n=1 Tax=Vairimorpha ceranae (strain BRL01) TaxID=578460 RepID=C4V8Z5_VAIC1|nr:hypothetical protein NCER_101003 [Vairimorpha ceranae BRL01]
MYCFLYIIYPMNLKEEIVKVLNNRPINNLFPYITLDCNDFENLDCNDFLLLCISIVNAKFYEQNNKKEESIAEYTNFIFYIDDIFCLDNESKNNKKIARLSKIYSNVKCNKNISRTDKIYMYNIKKSFKFHFIDWEDQEWLLSLLEYFYILSIENIYFLQLELSFQEIKKEHSPVQAKIVKRNDLLTNRIKPKYTLEEFGEKLSKKIEERMKIKAPVANETKDEEVDISVLRKNDELKDQKHNTRGNTDNVS